MKKILIISIFIIVFAGFVGSVNAKTFRLKLIWGDTKSDKTAAEIDGPDGWIAELEKATEGRIKITTYYIGQLVPNNEVYDSIIKGVGDIGALNISATPGRFLATELFTVPPLNTNCRQPSAAAWEFYQKFPEVQKEYSDTKILTMLCRPTSPPGNCIGTSDRPVRTLEDMKGLKISAPGKTKQDLMKALGASPMSVPPPEFYQSLKKGILDGICLDPVFYKTYSLKEVLHYQTNVNLGFGPWFVAMNWDKWNSLPKDIQKILVDTASGLGRRADTYANAVAYENIQAAQKEYGLEVIELPPAEVERWIKIQAPLIQKFIDDRKANGMPAQEIYDGAIRLMKKYE